MNTEKMLQDLGGGAVFEVGEANTAYAQYFIGQSYLKMLTTERVGIGNVTFEPGCRNNWHIHHKGGQILLVTGGKALAWRGCGQLVPASGSGGTCRGSFQRVAGGCHR